MTQTVTEGRAAATGTLVDAPDTPVAPSMSATERVPRTGRRVWERAVAWRWTPLALLGLLSAGSLGSRVAYLGEPSGRLIGDEPYYVNAARVILGQAPGADSGFTSATAGIDPVVAHPPLVKVLIAASIRVFGDNPLGWRFPSILFGSIALLAMYWLVRGAGGGRWLALGCASVMALDSLFVVYGRTG
ncbi:MAG TPA: glycosyltransferase family 39 protein, partial [Candidatus Dormibacteraeota bacterium]|nr:glycosyltransferase family 39 protein [Candidatus Dormibacteraeota bacterium]